MSGVCVDEVIGLVLPLLSPRDLASACAVSRAWRSAASVGDIWLRHARDVSEAVPGVAHIARISLPLEPTAAKASFAAMKQASRVHAAILSGVSVCVVLLRGPKVARVIASEDMCTREVSSDSLTPLPAELLPFERPLCKLVLSERASRKKFKELKNHPAGPTMQEIFNTEMSSLTLGMQFLACFVRPARAASKRLFLRGPLTPKTDELFRAIEVFLLHNIMLAADISDIIPGLPGTIQELSDRMMQHCTNSVYVEALLACCRGHFECHAEFASESWDEIRYKGKLFPVSLGCASSYTITPLSRVPRYLLLMKALVLVFPGAISAKNAIEALNDKVVTTIKFFQKDMK